MERRAFVVGLASASFFADRATATHLRRSDEDQLVALERRYGGRLGVAVLNSATNHLVEHRGHERFPLCSTYKMHLAAYVLARADRGLERLDRKISYTRETLVPYSPITEKHWGKQGMAVGDLCEAAITLSDNTAANLLLNSSGGPKALTTYLSSIGDNSTRLDRREPELNEATPGDPRDTTTPLATLKVLQRLITGRALSPHAGALLVRWLVASTTGGQRIRAGVRNDWTVGDKTGTGSHNVTNDIAVIWPGNGAPIFVTAYYMQAEATGTEREGVLAEVGRLACAI